MDAEITPSIQRGRKKQAALALHDHAQPKKLKPEKNWSLKSSTVSGPPHLAQGDK